MAERQQTTLNLRHYLGILWRRRAIIIVCTLVVPAIVVGVSLTQPKLYRGVARIMVSNQASTLSAASGTTFDGGTPDDREVQTLASLVVTPENISRALAKLGWNDPVLKTMDQVSATADTGANIISVEAELETPERSRDLANAVAESFVEWRRDDEQRSLSEAIALVDKQIATTPRTTLAYQGLLERRGQLEVLKTLTTGGVTVGEAAQSPRLPSQPRPKRNGAAALAAGFLLGVGLAFVRESLDIKVHSADELHELTGLPILAEIAEFRRGESDSGKVITLADPRSQLAESYRFLRNNLDFLNFDGHLKTILVTSPLPTQGKTTTIANLAVVLLRAGKRVTMVEGDLRRPTLHTYFNLPAVVGLTSVISGAATLDEVVRILPLSDDGVPLVDQAREQSDDDALGVLDEQTAGGPPTVRGLRILTAGPVPPNPGEIVSSQRFRDVLDKVSRNADYVLVDAPPLLAVGDAAALAGHVDGVLVVARLKDTTRPMATRINEFLERVPARVLGIVVTGAPRRGTKRSDRYTAYYE